MSSFTSGKKPRRKIHVLDNQVKQFTQAIFRSSTIFEKQKLGWHMHTH